MRNFVTNSHVNFQTYTVNFGEYTNDGVFIQDVLRELAVAFETPYREVLWSWENEVLFNKPYSRDIVPSEYEVLTQLMTFSIWVVDSLETKGACTQSRVFCYVNLNTGKTVVWSHFVG